jgi:hypothetical protein
MNTCYFVTVTTAPFSPEMKQEIGYYNDRILANKAIKFLMDYYVDADFRVEECKSNKIIVHYKMDMIEYQRLLDLKLRVEK